MTITTRLGSGIAALAPRLLAATYGAACLAHADALRAAGVTGHAPPNAGAIKKFVETLTSNALWMIGTTAVLAIVLVGALFFFGHTRAQDLAAKIAIGALIVISAGGLAA
jgi:hypothetical protein